MKYIANNIKDIFCQFPHNKIEQSL